MTRPMKSTLLFRKLSAVLALWLLAPATGSAAPGLSDWPSYLGPSGNFGESSGARLIDDMRGARLVWESEEKNIGFGKAHTGAGKTGVGRDFLGLPPGGEASPIVADGLVIMSYFAPCGDVWDAEIEQRMGASFEKHVWRISADDVVLAMDAKTGKTRWKQVFAARGINTGAGKRGGWAVTPVAAKGKVFALGTTGRVYALDLTSGKPLWETNIGPAHLRLEQGKREGIQQRRMALPLSKVSRPYGMLVVINGVLLAPDWNAGLLGIDTETGGVLWRLNNPREPILSGFNGPCPARVEGKDYAVCVNRTGALRLIDPKSGAILWTVPLECEHLTQPVATEDYLLVFVSNPTHREGKEANINQTGVLAAYRFNEKGATRDWVISADHAHELKLDAGPARRVIPRGGLVYYLARSQRDRREHTFLVIRERDGTILKAHEIDAGQFYLWGDRVVTVTDLTHRPRAANREIWQLYTADAEFRQLGGGWHINDPNNRVHYATGGYELPVYEAFSNGLMFARVMGGIRCYDLRQASKE